MTLSLSNEPVCPTCEGSGLGAYVGSGHEGCEDCKATGVRQSPVPNSDDPILVGRGELRGGMVYVRETAIDAVAGFPGETLSDRILAAAAREVTDEMVDRLAWFIADLSPEDKARGLGPIATEYERARRLLAAAFSTQQATEADR